MGHDTLTIIPEQEFPTAIARVEAELEKSRTCGCFTAKDGAQMFYEFFTPKHCVGSLVVVHGLSEFTKKYYELTHYLLKRGFRVFLYDQRGHGLSHRDTDRPELIHVPGFDVLVGDLDRFLEAVVLPNARGPLYLFAHSMGGAVGLQYLAEHPHRFQKALISSPLLQPTTSGLPPFLFRWGTGIHRALGGGKRKFLFSREYDPNRPYTHVPGDSESRVRHCLSYRNRDRRYQSTPMTVDCVYHSLGLKRQLLSPAVTGAIRTPILMLCAGQDTMVRLEPQEAFADRCRRCQRVVLPGANHALLTNCDETLSRVLDLVLDFFEM